MTNYPSAPGIRMAFDTDGTRVFRVHAQSNNALELGLAAKQALGEEDSTPLVWPARVSGQDQLVFLFPEPRDVVGITAFIQWRAYDNNGSLRGQSLGSIDNLITGTTATVTDVNAFTSDQARFYPVRCLVSRDTTTGFDGSWTSTSFTGGTFRSALGQGGGDFSDLHTYTEKQVPGATPGTSLDDTRAGEITGAAFQWSRGVATFNSQYPPNTPCGNNPGYPLTRTRIATTSGDFTGIRGLKILIDAITGSPSSPTYGRPQAVPDSTSASQHYKPYLNAEFVALYGQHSPGDTQHKIEFWHPTLERLLTQADMDQGDAAINRTVTTQFRLKNVSPTKTASKIAVFIDEVQPTDLTVGNPTAAWLGYQISADGVNFYNGVTLTSIAPGAEILLTVKRSLDDNSSLGVYAPRIGFRVLGGWA